jgi:hypothetical protein
VKREREERLLRHGDAARIIRQAQREIAAGAALARRQQEVDGPVRETPQLEIPLLAVERSDGTWEFTTTTEVFPGHPGSRVLERSESIAICEMRQAIRDDMVEARYMRPEDARRALAQARVYVSGRVPFARIVSR